MFKFFYEKSSSVVWVTAAYAYLSMFLFVLNLICKNLRHEVKIANPSVSLPPEHLVFSLLPDSHIARNADVSTYPVVFQNLAVVWEGGVWDHQACVDHAKALVPMWASEAPKGVYMQARMFDTLFGTYIGFFFLAITCAFVSRVCFKAKATSPIYVMMMLSVLLAFLGDFVENGALFAAAVTDASPEDSSLYRIACLGVPFKLTFAFILPTLFNVVGACWWLRWSGFFVAASVSNLSQSWFFWYAKQPSTSGAALLGFSPSMPEALLKASCSIVDSPLCETGLNFLQGNKRFTDLWDQTIWTVVAVAGVLYMIHGVSGCRLPTKMVLLFGILKLQTALMIGFISVAGEEGPLTKAIGLSEVVWGSFFLSWYLKNDGAGQNNAKKVKKA
ncbi:hypothetical protein TrST_g1873 [Triparma strigata]|uniref:Uncharacterized protein n=1 Tax=Triparma strigata TaxID=1606541 RepID=A0A9W7ESL6_9STRA|nr:hypothetical protein TrST_g1873 [Triparma strigata]